MSLRPRASLLPRLAVPLFAGLLSMSFVASAAPPPPAEPAKLHAAMEALKLAQRDLEAAPSDQGGHRNKALQLIERALEQCERSAESLRQAH